MATKYVRRSRIGAGIRAAPAGPLRWLARMDPRRRLIIIYVGLIFFALILFGNHQYNAPARFTGAPLVKGQGLILEKRVDGDQHVLVIELARADAPPLKADAQVDAAAWNQLEQGDRVAIIYQVNRGQTEVRIREVGRVALQEPIR